MAILHKKEEKIQAVLGRLPKKYTNEEFVAMFIKLYSKDWGKIKAAYIKQSQDKEPGKIINMPKPDLYLKQVLDIYLSKKETVLIEEVVEVEVPVAKVVTSKAKKVAIEVEAAVPTKKVAASKAKKAVIEAETKAPSAKAVTTKAKKVATEVEAAVPTTKATISKAKKAVTETKTPVAKVVTSKDKKVATKSEAEASITKAPVKKKISIKKAD